MGTRSDAASLPQDVDSKNLVAGAVAGTDKKRIDGKNCMVNHPDCTKGTGLV